MDSVRNMTCSPISGIDPHELLDVRPLSTGGKPLNSFLKRNISANLTCD